MASHHLRRLREMLRGPAGARVSAKFGKIRSFRDTTALIAVLAAAMPRRRPTRSSSAPRRCSTASIRALTQAGKSSSMATGSRHWARTWPHPPVPGWSTFPSPRWCPACGVQFMAAVLCWDQRLHHGATRGTPRVPARQGGPSAQSVLARV